MTYGAYSMVRLLDSFCGNFGLCRTGNARVSIGNIAGFVVTEHGKPVAHATVTMQTSYGQSPSATHTDANGHFEFARYETGQYDLQAYWHGMFSDWKKRVDNPFRQNDRYHFAASARCRRHGNRPGVICPAARPFRTG